MLTSTPDQIEHAKTQLENHLFVLPRVLRDLTYDEQVQLAYALRKCNEGIEKVLKQWDARQPTDEDLGLR